MTRVVTYMSGSESNGLAIPEIGIPQTRHELSHHNGDPEQMARLSRSDAFITQQFSYFLDQLQGTQDGEDSLLDRTMVLFGSGMSYGHSHGNARLANLLLTMMQKMDVKAEQFVDSLGPVSEVV